MGMRLVNLDAYRARCGAFDPVALLKALLGDIEAGTIEKPARLLVVAETDGPDGVWIDVRLAAPQGDAAFAMLARAQHYLARASDGSET